MEVERVHNRKENGRAKTTKGFWSRVGRAVASGGSDGCEGLVAIRMVQLSRLKLWRSQRKAGISVIELKGSQIKAFLEGLRIMLGSLLRGHEKHSIASECSGVVLVECL